MPTSKGDTSLVTVTEQACSVTDDARHQGIGDMVLSDYLCVGSQSLQRGEEKPRPKPGGKPSFMKVIHKEGKYLREESDGHEESVPASDSQTAKEEVHASSSHHHPGGKSSFMKVIHKEEKAYLQREGDGNNQESARDSKQQKN